MPFSVLKQIDALTTMDKVRGYVVLGFSVCVGVAFLVSLACMILFPASDVWGNVFLTCLGYIVGILTGLLGLPPVGSEERSPLARAAEAISGRKDASRF